MEALERQFSRRGLAFEVEGLLVSAGSSMSLAEVLKYLRRRGYDVNALSDRLLDMGFQVHRGCLELPGLRSGPRVTEDDDGIEATIKC